MELPCKPATFYIYKISSWSHIVWVFRYQSCTVFMDCFAPLMAPHVTTMRRYHSDPAPECLAPETDWLWFGLQPFNRSDAPFWATMKTWGSKFRAAKMEILRSGLLTPKHVVFNVVQLFSSEWTSAFGCSGFPGEEVLIPVKSS